MYFGLRKYTKTQIFKPLGIYLNKCLVFQSFSFFFNEIVRNAINNKTQFHVLLQLQLLSFPEENRVSEFN